jgi:hypothetical protein
MPTLSVLGVQSSVIEVVRLPAIVSGTGSRCSRR